MRQNSLPAIRKNHCVKAFSYLLAFSWVGIFSAIPDTLVLNSGSTIEGAILRTNGGRVLILTDYCTSDFARTTIKDIRLEAETPVETQKVGRLPNFRSSILSLSRQTWSSNLTQIPATVIDKGVFKNVPYISFRCGGDYEVNIYGTDRKDIAAIEIGVYRKLLNDDDAKQNCLKFITRLLNLTEDKKVVQSLNLEKDLKERDGLSFEVTPPGGEDAYFGWWVSVSSEEELNRSRASEQELANITVPKAAAATNEDASGWSANEMKLARPLAASTPAPEQASRWSLPATVTPPKPPLADTYSAGGNYGGNSSSYVPSGGGSVYVRAHTRSNGTYVKAHYRRPPR